MAEKKEKFSEAYSRARTENPGFTEGGKNAQGLNPMASLGYQAGNIRNQFGDVNKGSMAGALAANTSGRGSSISMPAPDANTSGRGGSLAGLEEGMKKKKPSLGLASTAQAGELTPNPGIDNAGLNSVQTAPDDQSANMELMPSHQVGPGANYEQPSLKGQDYSSTRKDGPILLTNVGLGNEGGNAIGDVDAFKTGVQANQKKKFALSGSHPMGSDGKIGVGNMDVTFADGTDPAAAKRFLEDPVRPTAQIDRFNSRASSPRALKEAAPAEEGMPELITRETHPNIDAKTAQAMNTSIINGWQQRKGLKVSGKNTLANTKLSGENTLENTEADNLAKQGEQNRDLVAEGYRFGAPMSDAASDVYNTPGGKPVNLSGLSSVPRNTGKSARTNPYPVFVKPQYDDDGNIKPGTNVWNKYQEQNPDTDLSAFDNYNPKSGMNKGQSALIQSLIAGENYDALEALSNQFGLQLN